MKVLRLGLLPVPVFYTERVPGYVNASGESGRFAGGTPWFAPIILLRPECRSDQGILQHELEHVRQWWTAFFLVGGIVVLNVCQFRAALGDAFWQAAFFGLWLSWLAHPLCYQASRRYRRWSETRAYRTQLKHHDATGARMTLTRAAELLSSSRYGLQITPRDARRLLADD